MTRRRVIVVALILVVFVVLLVRWLATPLARPALGYVAKTVCSDIFLGGATAEQALGDLPREPVARIIRTHIDTTRRFVRAGVPLVASRRAAFAEGHGCTLDAPVSARSVNEALPRSSAAGDASLLWPEGERVVAGGNAALDAVVARAFEEPDTALRRNTRAIVIVHGGRIIAERYAYGYRAGTRFTGWSMSKSVTSALVGIMVGANRLAVSDTALLPEWRSALDGRRRIRLHDLLQMSSGLDFDESYTPSGGATRMLFDADNAAAVAAASGLAHQPGTHWQYSSGTTNIIARIMRNVMGDDSAYAQFPRAALFDRIGMQSAVFERDPSGTFVGSSFLYATARDWARFGLLFLRDGVWMGERVLPEGWVAYSTTPAPAAPRGRYGAQWWLNAGEPDAPGNREWPALPRDLYWASGFNGQYVAIVPSRDLIVVRLGNTAGEATWSLGDFLAEVLAVL